MQLRPGELTVDKLDMIEDTKGNTGDLGRLIVTNLRIIWHSLSLPRINLSIGYNTFITVNTKILHTVHDVYIQALHILTSFRNSRYEFIFTNHDTKSTRHYTSVIGVHRAYVSSKIYREIKLRSGIIRENRLVLLPQEKVHSSVKDVWNLSIEQGNIGTFIITNIRLVWYADVNYQFNVSIPYLTIGNSLIIRIIRNEGSPYISKLRICFSCFRVNPSPSSNLDTRNFPYLKERLGEHFNSNNGYNYLSPNQFHVLNNDVPDLTYNSYANTIGSCPRASFSGSDGKASRAYRKASQVLSRPVFRGLSPPQVINCNYDREIHRNALIESVDKYFYQRFSLSTIQFPNTINFTLMFLTSSHITLHPPHTLIPQTTTTTLATFLLSGLPLPPVHIHDWILLSNLVNFELIESSLHPIFSNSQFGFRKFPSSPEWQIMSGAHTLVPTHHFLGIILDSGLTGRLHLESTAIKAKKILEVLSAIRSTWWGAHPPINALFAEAKKPPLHFRFQFLAAKYFTKILSVIDHPTAVSLFRLADASNDASLSSYLSAHFPTPLLFKESSTVFYNDGSKIDNNHYVGSAVYSPQLQSYARLATSRGSWCYFRVLYSDYFSSLKITIRTSKFGPTLVILSTEASGGYILGFRVNPLQQLHITYKEISILRSEFEKFPIFGVEYTFEHQAPVQEEISVEHFTEIQDNQAEISNIFGYYFSERETSQRKPNYSIHLGLATEEPREGSTLQNLWELVPSSVN
ncbi:BBS5 protein, partial [Acromyrmex heyeri]